MNDKILITVFDVHVYCNEKSQIKFLLKSSIKIEPIYMYTNLRLSWLIFNIET